MIVTRTRSREKSARRQVSGKTLRESLGGGSKNQAQFFGATASDDDMNTSSNAHGHCNMKEEKDECGYGQIIQQLPKKKKKTDLFFFSIRSQSNSDKWRESQRIKLI